MSGNWEELPDRIVAEINKSIQITQGNSGLILNIVLNYGARKEITQACKEICKAVLEKKLTIDRISEDIIKEYLYTEIWQNQTF